MKKVLLPIDGSARSLRTIEMAKQLYAPGDVELTILMVLAGQMHIDGHFEVERLQRKDNFALFCSSTDLEGGYESL